MPASYALGVPLKPLWSIYCVSWRFYTFDLNGLNKKELIPRNYSVISSEYDSANDYMYVFAQLDKNNNGQNDDKEDIHVFWIDLKNPNNNGRQY